MSSLIVLAVENSTYTDTWITESDGTVNGTHAKLDLTGFAYNDVRLTSFSIPGTNPVYYVEMCNRNGQPGQKGAGTHWPFIPPVPTSLPTEATDLNVVSNPYATAYFQGYMYINDFDTPDLYAVNVPGFTLANRGNKAWSFPRYLNRTNSGIALDLSGDYLFATFSTSTGYTAPYELSTVVRLSQSGSAGALTANDPTDFIEIGKNVISTTVVSYAPQTTVVPPPVNDYLLAACIGGAQGSGNNAASMVSVVDLSNWQALTAPVDGTYNSLDIKGITSTPPSTDPNPGKDDLETGDSFIYILAASYDENWQTLFTVAEVKASYIIEKAINGGAAENLGANAYKKFIVPGIPYNGYFWAVAFVPDSPTATPGRLIVGKGFETNDLVPGDNLWIYTVTTAGVNINSYIIIDSNNLYGAANCVINTMTVTTVSGSSKILRATPPQAVSISASYRADYAAREKKKSKS
jgi:hypothetical protein